MASKYDTNPLDPDFPKKAAQQAAQAGAQQTRDLSNVEEETRAFSGAPTAEDPTRRYNNGFGNNGNFDQANYNHYAYAQPQAQPPAAYQTTQTAQTVHLPEADKPSNRKVNSVGLPENVMMVLPYAPFYIGLVAGILELLFVPQSETKVRFHAAQGLALHIAIFLITFLLSFIANFTSGARYGNLIFGFVAMIGLIITMVRVWKGKAVHFEFLDNLTTWLSEKITLKKQ